MLKSLYPVPMAGEHLQRQSRSLLERVRRFPRGEPAVVGQIDLRPASRRPSFHPTAQDDVAARLKHRQSPHPVHGKATICRA